MSRHTRTAVFLILVALALMLGLTVVSASPDIPALDPEAGVPVAGRVYFDLNMNGAFDSGEPAVDGARISLLNSLGNLVQGPLTTSDADPDPGAFTFTGVLPGSYTVAESDVLDAVRTPASPISINVGAAPVTGINFGIVLKWTVTGRAYTDSNPNGAYDPRDEVLVGATVMIIDDRNSNGRMDAGEPILGSDESDGSGFYIIPSIVPGNRILMVQPAGIGGVWSDPVPLFLPTDPINSNAVVDVPYVESAAIGLTGIVWNDVDGDEIVGDGEVGLSGVKVEVYGAVSGQTQGDPPLASVLTDANGRYQVSGLSAGWLYEIRPVAATLPTGWLMSTDPALLFVAPTAEGPNVVDVGYYDPFSTAPLRQSDWKKELKQAGKPRYTPAQISGFIATAEASSGVFAEVAGIREVMLKSPVQGELGHALKEYAALRLNLASSRLYEATPVNLPELTAARTIGAAVAEIEGILAPGRTPAPTKNEYQRVRKLAEAINKGTGLGSGQTGVFSPAYATYRGAQVAFKLRPGGDLVDLGTDEPAYLLKWSPGKLDPAINVAEAKLRINVKTFMDGGVLDVVQVLPDGSIVVLGTVVPPVWNKDIKTTYTFDLRGVSTAVELISSEIRLVTRDITAGGKAARTKIDSAELVFKY